MSFVHLSAQSWVQEASQGPFWIKKVLSDTVVATGQPFSYTVYYSIPQGATNVTISDYIDPQLIFLGFTINSSCGTPSISSPTIGSNGGTFSLTWSSVSQSFACSFTITVKFPNGTTCDTTAMNRVCLNGQYDNKFYEFCTRDIVIKSVAVNPWHIYKYPIGLAWQGGQCPYISPSDTISYQICVYKDVGTTGQLNLVNGVVSDTLPNGAILVSSNCGATQSGSVITWNIGNLSADQMYNTVCCTFKVYYPNSLFTPGTSLFNRATLSGGLGNANNPCSNFSVQSNQTCVQVGQIISGNINKWVTTNRQPGCSGYYTLYVCNNGTTPLPFNIIDTLPSALINYSISYQYNVTATLSGGILSANGTLNPGQCGQINVTFTIPQNAPIGTTITNCAWLLIPGLLPKQTCTSFTIDSLSAKPCLWKEVCNYQQQGYTPGSIFRIRLRIQNIGGLSMTNIVLTDQLNPNLEYVGNPSHYMSSSWNTQCNTSTSWSGVSGISYNPITNQVTMIIDTIPATCQNIFYPNCGMYGTSGVPFYFIEFDVKVKDSSALGNIPNSFTLSGGNLGNNTFTSNITHILVVGTSGFSINKGVKKHTDQNYSTSVSTAPNSIVDFKLQMSSSGTAQLRHVTFVDLLPRNNGLADNRILQVCGTRSTGNYDIVYDNFIGSTPSITSQWKNPATSLANVNILNPTGAPGNAFTLGCGSAGSWASSAWVAGDKNLGAYFGPSAIGTSAFIEFSSKVVQGPAQIFGTECNSFAASGWVKHLIQSSLTSFQLAGQVESEKVCVSIDTSSQKPCIDSLKVSIKCLGVSPDGYQQYAIQVNGTSCTPAVLLVTSPDGSFTPTSFTMPSSPWVITTTFTHTSTNNSIKVYYTLSCNNIRCRDSAMVKLPDCDTPPPQENCCVNFFKSIKSQINWTSNGYVYLSASLAAGPVPIKKFTATIVSAQMRSPKSLNNSNCLYSGWKRIFGDIVGGSLLVAPAPGPQLLNIFSREAIWGEGECINWMKGANLKLNMVFPPYSGGLFNTCRDTLMFAIRYSFTDCKCLTCDTVIYYKIARYWKPTPWDPIGSLAHKTKDVDKTQSEPPTSTSLIMESANKGTLWVVNPDLSENDIIITGVEIASYKVPLVEIKNGIVDQSVGFIETNIQAGNTVPIDLTFKNETSLSQFSIEVRFRYKFKDNDEIFYTDQYTFLARVPGLKQDEMGIDLKTKPEKVATFALYVTNSNGYKEGIAYISIKPKGNLKILALGPPNSNKQNESFLLPNLNESGSYTFGIPGNVSSSIESNETVNPIFVTVAGWDQELGQMELEYATFDINGQILSKGILMLSNPISTVEEEIPTSISGSISTSLAPNPSSGYVTLTFALYQPAYTSLYLLDVTGREILRIFDNVWFETGSYIKGLDLNNLPVGMYYVILQTQNGSTAKPLLIVK